jgi:hypothetical protein
MTALQVWQWLKAFFQAIIFTFTRLLLYNQDEVIPKDVIFFRESAIKIGPTQV